MKSPFKIKFNQIRQAGISAELTISHKMPKKEAKRLVHLMYQSHMPIGMDYIFNQDNYDWLRGNVKEIVDMCNKRGVTGSEIFKIWADVKKERSINNEVYKARPIPEGRDNKGVYVGSGSGGSNRIRYPKKNKSRSTWKKFYEMFPHLAEIDKWDGKTSKRMK